MSHFLNHQFIHLIWATKNLAPLIAENSKIPLLNYLAGTLKRVGGLLIASSATSNHLHLLANTPTNLSIAELLQQTKACSSKWYRSKDVQNAAFGWNEGYSAFTVSPDSIDKVKRYFAADKCRNNEQSFEDELEGFLKIQEIAFNPVFLTCTTHTKLIYHFVWSVKNRELFLDRSLEIVLHQHMQQEVEKNGCKLYAMGYVADHMHLVVESTSKISTASLVQNLKTTTTHFIKSLGKKFTGFNWQEGYGVFSVGKPALEAVVNYANDQENHHRTKTFEEEWSWLRGMNDVHGMVR